MMKMISKKRIRFKITTNKHEIGLQTNINYVSNATIMMIFIEEL